MDYGRSIYTATQLYVLVLIVGSLGTLAWVFGLFNRGSAQVAGIWFAVSGFGVLVLITMILIQFTRD